MHPVKHQAKLHNWICDRLLHEFPDADAETIKDTLEGLTDLPEILAGVIRSALNSQPPEELCCFAFKKRPRSLRAKRRNLVSQAKT